MKTGTVLGILLIVLGAVALAYQGISYTTQKKVLDIGSIHATKEEHKTIPLPPIVGGVALLAGLVLLFGDSKNT
jgi:drug/metabolite transporter (DMT)-like permease